MTARRLAVIVMAVLSACSGLGGIGTQLEQKTEPKVVDSEQVFTDDLREAMAIQSGDTLLTVAVDDFRVLVRIREKADPHVHATSCDVLALFDLPEGWEGTCLERTMDGRRVVGIFEYGMVSG